MKICIAGKGSCAIKCINFLLTIYQKKKICCIVSSKDKGKDTWDKSLLKFCKQKKIKVINLSYVKKIKKIIFFSIQYDKIININSFKTDIFYNLHFSLLPKYRGVLTSINQLLNNETISGCTIHKIDNGIDTGKIITQRKIKIKKNITAKDLYFSLIDCGYKLFKNKILYIINNKPEGHKQKKSVYFSKKKFKFPGPKIDYKLKANKVVKTINAYTFWPFQGFLEENKKIIKAIKTNIKTDKIEKTFYGKKNYFLKNTKDFKIKLFFNNIS